MTTVLGVDEYEDRVGVDEYDRVGADEYEDEGAEEAP
jgi:hypothetical protein